MSDTGDTSDISGNRSVGAGFSLGLGDIAGTSNQVKDLRKNVGDLLGSLKEFERQAPSISRAIGSVTSALQGGGASSGSGTGSGSSYSNGGIGGALRSVGSSFGNSLFGSMGGEGGWMRNLMLAPTRFMTSQINSNRDLALSASGALGMQAFATGTTTPNIMTALAGNFGNVMGSPQELLSLMDIARRLGAAPNMQSYAGTGTPGQGVNNPPRAAGFFESIRQAQRMNPSADVGQLAGSIGGYVGNVGAQQMGTFLTGGAFSMVGPGNRQKSISEWSDSILKFLQGQRPGGKRGQPFTYGELMTQNFPGSNIDAWLSVNGVPETMKDYFWTYALAKSNAGATTDIFGDNYAPTQTNVSFQRLQAGNAQSQAGFRLAGTLSGQYSNREQSNRWFNEIMGQMMQSILPSALTSGSLSFTQFMPDAMQDLMMQLMERTTLGTAAGGMLGWGSLFPGGLSDKLMSGATGLIPGDVGDVGDYGPLGGTTTAGLHPDMRKRVDAMMAVNPRLKMTSGFRDLGTQQRLKRKGIGRVSGRPSEHTRGRAADLGPASEYGWLVANAGRFGLSSGMSAGEPWHVGMGDVDIGEPTIPDTPAGAAGALSSALSTATGAGSSLLSGAGNLINMLLGVFGNFGSLFKADATASDQIAGVAGGTASILKAFMSVFAGKTVDSSKLKQYDVYDQLVAGTQAAMQKGIPSTGIGLDTSLFGGATGATAGGTGGTAGSGNTSGLGGATSMNAFFSQVLNGLGAPVTENNLDKFAAWAKFEGNRAAFNPTNYTSGPGTNFNSVGVKNYPDWNTGVTQLTTKLQRGDRGIPVMLGNLRADGGYRDFLDATSAFYHSWGGSSIPQISQANASAYLSTKVAGAGDVDDYDYAMASAMPASQQVHFHNTFKIEGGSNGNSGGIDARRTAAAIADHLERQMQQRVARSN